MLFSSEGFSRAKNLSNIFQAVVCQGLANLRVRFSRDAVPVDIFHAPVMTFTSVFSSLPHSSWVMPNPTWTLVPSTIFQIKSYLSCGAFPLPTLYGPAMLILGCVSFTTFFQGHALPLLDSAPLQYLPQALGNRASSPSQSCILLYSCLMFISDTPQLLT